MAVFTYNWLTYNRRCKNPLRGLQHFKIRRPKLIGVKRISGKGTISNLLITKLYSFNYSLNLTINFASKRGDSRLHRFIKFTKSRRDS